MSSALSLAIVVAFGFLLFLLERMFPLRRTKARLLPRVFVNVCLSAFTLAVAVLGVQPLVTHLLQWTSQTPFGLLQALSLPSQISAILGFLILDLTFYYWHLANHLIPFLWRFHNVHHIDPDLDVSTGFRFHFGEVAWSAVFRIIQISLVGPSLVTFAAYELVFRGCVYFHHSNLRLPIRVERLLNLIFVTPRMHGIHHSQVFAETNSNYGTVFPWWDRLHRTLRLNIPQRDIAIGIAGYSAPADNTLWYALSLPFRRQRDYWRRRDGEIVPRTRGTLPGTNTQLAE